MALTFRKILCKDGTFVTERNKAAEMRAKEGMSTKTFFMWYIVLKLAYVLPSDTTICGLPIFV